MRGNTLIGAADEPFLRETKKCATFSGVALVILNLFPLG
jgi:hypothetical protein